MEKYYFYSISSTPTWKNTIFVVVLLDFVHRSRANKWRRSENFVGFRVHWFIRATPESSKRSCRRRQVQTLKLNLSLALPSIGARLTPRPQTSLSFDANGLSSSLGVQGVGWAFRI